MITLLIIGILLVLIGAGISIISFYIANRNDYSEGQLIALVIITVVLSIISIIYGIIFINESIDTIINNLTT